MCKCDPATGGVCSPADGTHSAALFEQFKTHPLWHVDLSSSVSLCRSLRLRQPARLCLSHTQTRPHAVPLSLCSTLSL